MPHIHTIVHERPVAATLLISIYSKRLYGTCSAANTSQTQKENSFDTTSLDHIPQYTKLPKTHNALLYRYFLGAPCFLFLYAI